MKTKPIESLLGKEGNPVECKAWNEELSMHWFETDAREGDSCLCGKTKKKVEPDNKQS